MNKQNVLNKLACINAQCEKRGLKTYKLEKYTGGYYHLTLSDESERPVFSGKIKEIGVYLAGMMEILFR